MHPCPSTSRKKKTLATTTNNPSQKKAMKAATPVVRGLTRFCRARVTLHAVPEAERDCIHCGERMQVIGHIDHERVEYIPARIEVAVDRREKVACVDCHQDITTAPRPGACTGDADAKAAPAVGPAAQHQAGTNAKTAGPEADAVAGPHVHVYRRAGASLLAHLLEAKCDDAMPVYRQRQQLARLGFNIPLNTLYGYWNAACDIVEPVAQISALAMCLAKTLSALTTRALIGSIRRPAVRPDAGTLVVFCR